MPPRCSPRRRPRWPVATRSPTRPRKAGLIAPANLRLAFEDDDGFGDATAETSAELDVIARYAAAEALATRRDDAVPDARAVDATPDVTLAEARAAFASGDLEASASASEDVAFTWSTAESVGQSRALSIGLIVLAVLFGLALLITTLRRRRRRRRRRVTMQATRLHD